MSEAGLTRIGLAIQPLDLLFFRDGRPFDAAHRIESGLPSPQVLAGAMRTWLLRESRCDFRRLAEAMEKGASFPEATADGQPPAVAEVGRVEFRGPWFARPSPEGAWEVLVPAPANLARIRATGELTRLDPLGEGIDLPGWDPPEPMMRPLWPRDPRPAERVEGYLSAAGLRAFLDGGVPEDRDVLVPPRIFRHDPRTGIVIDPRGLTAQEGMIYGTSLLALRPEISLYGEAIGPPGAIGRVPSNPIAIPFGGEGRRVAIRRTEAVAWPAARASDGGKSLLLLTAPGFFEGNWSPSWLRPVAAAVSGSVGISGWDLARRRPKPTRFGVAAGSVYFLRESLRPTPPSLCSGEDSATGWGSFVEGRWVDV